MKAEIEIDDINKLDIRLLGGSEDVLYTSIPYQNNMPYSFNTNEVIRIFCFYEKHAFHFYTKFINEKKDNRGRYFVFKIVKIQILDNKRKEPRINMIHPAAIFNEEELVFGIILDMSKSGMKIVTKTPIKNKKIKIRFGEEETEQGTVVWERHFLDSFHYGIHLKTK